MKQILSRITECITMLLPFLKRRDAKELREFSDLITGQYEFLTAQLERVLKDYFEVSARVKEMHTEIFTLKAQLAEAMAERCSDAECKSRLYH